MTHSDWIPIYRLSACLGLGVLLGQTALANPLASGDFNGDGRSDLAVGVPDEDIAVGVAIQFGAGAVNVLYGGDDTGLTATGDEFLNQDVTDVADTAEANDQFGYALAAGDFNGDGYDDLAVGLPGQRVGLDPRAGAVHVFYGGASGFIVTAGGVTTVSDRVWQRDSAGVMDSAEPYDEFGHSLAAGDFNGDGYDDLGVGVPFDDPGAAQAGSVHILHGSATGLTATDNAATAANEDDQIWHQDVGAIDNVSEPQDLFGWSLATGDFDGDGHDDLAVGVPGESIGPGLDGDPDAGPKNAGAVNVIYGSARDGLTDAGNDVWFQSRDVPGLLDTAEAGDNLGWSLATGDFDGDGYDDLAVGVPGEDIAIGVLVIADAGGVNVLYGARGFGLSAAGDQFWNQESPGIHGASATGDQFGFALAAGDFDGDGRTDLAVGIPFDEITSGGLVLDGAGAVTLIYGTADLGLTSADSRLWHQNSTGIEDSSESDDHFGASLAAGHFDSGDYADLAVGVPQESITSAGVATTHAGGANVIYGSDVGLHQDLGHADQFWHQNSSGVEDQNEAHDHFGGHALPD